MTARDSRAATNGGICDHVSLPVPDLEAAVSWFDRHFEYVDHARGRWGGYDFARLGPREMGPQEATVEVIANEQLDSVTETPASPVVAIRVADTTAAVRTLADDGIEVEHRPTDLGPTRYRVDGPGGHPIDLVDRDTGTNWAVDHVTLGVSTADGTIGWYVRTFGYALAARYETAAAWRYRLAPPTDARDAVGIELRQTTRSDESVRSWSDGHLAVTCQDLSSFRATLARRGVEQAIGVDSCGGTRGLIQDAAGYPIELIERPPPP